MLTIAYKLRKWLQNFLSSIIIYNNKYYSLYSYSNNKFQFIYTLWLWLCFDLFAINDIS